MTTTNTQLTTNLQTDLQTGKAVSLFKQIHNELTKHIKDNPLKAGKKNQRYSEELKDSVTRLVNKYTHQTGKTIPFLSTALYELSLTINGAYKNSNAISCLLHSWVKKEQAAKLKRDTEFFGSKTRPVLFNEKESKALEDSIQQRIERVREGKLRAPLKVTKVTEKPKAVVVDIVAYPQATITELSPQATMNLHKAVKAEEKRVEAETLKAEAIVCDKDIKLAKKFLAKREDAKSRHLVFTLCLNDMKALLDQPRCAYTDLIMNERNGGSNDKHIVALDKTIERIDAGKGYTKANTITVSHLANQAKNVLLERSDSPLNFGSLENLEMFVNNMKKLGVK